MAINWLQYWPNWMVRCKYPSVRWSNTLTAVWPFNVSAHAYLRGHGVVKENITLCSGQTHRLLVCQMLDRNDTAITLCCIPLLNKGKSPHYLHNNKEIDQMKLTV